MTLINNLMAQFTPAKRSDADGAKTTSSFDLRSLLDWRLAAKPKDSVSDGDASAQTVPATEAPSIQSLLASMPPAVLRKLMEARTRFDSDEQARVMAIVAAVPPEELPAIVASLEKMSTDEIVALFRAQLAKPAGGQ